jgi:hypothetical protein
MPRRAKGPRLYLREGRAGREAVWVIRDGSVEVSTGRGAGEQSAAERALGDYIAAKFTAPVLKADSRRDPAQVLVAEVVALYSQDKAASSKLDAATFDRFVANLLGWWGDKTLVDVKRSTCQAYAAHRMAQPTPATRTRPSPPASPARRPGASWSSCSLDRLLARRGHADHAPGRLAPRQAREPARGPDALTGRCAAEGGAGLAQGRRWRVAASGAVRAGQPRPPSPLHPDRALHRHAALGDAGAALGGVPSSGLGRSRQGDDLPARTRRARDHQAPAGREAAAPAAGAHAAVAGDGFLDTARRKRSGFLRCPFSTTAASPSRARSGPASRAAFATPACRRRVTPHWMRHTAATWLMEGGVDMWEAAAYLGMTVATLEKHYGHHRADHQAGAVRAIAGRR